MVSATQSTISISPPLGSNWRHHRYSSCLYTPERPIPWIPRGTTDCICTALSTLPVHSNLVCRGLAKTMRQLNNCVGLITSIEVRAQRTTYSETYSETYIVRETALERHYEGEIQLMVERLSLQTVVPTLEEEELERRNSWFRGPSPLGTSLHWLTVSHAVSRCVCTVSLLHWLAISHWLALTSSLCLTVSVSR